MIEGFLFSGSFDRTITYRLQIKNNYLSLLLISMLTWSIEKIDLPLKYAWKISRNTSTHKTNLLVTVTDSRVTGQGEAAPNIRYGETPENLLVEFAVLKSLLPSDTLPLEQFSEVLDTLTCSKALRFALESAFVHYWCSKSGSTIAELLNIPTALATTTAYTIPIMDPGDMKKFYFDYRLNRFSFIKLKIGSDDPFDAVRHLSEFCTQSIMIDANEAFLNPEDCIRWFERIKSLPIEFVEQPLPSSMKEESVYLKRYSPFTLMADESITFDPDFDFLEKSFDGINMKLMKAGGYLNGIRILREARQRKLKTMIGCMVETTLGISSGLHLSSFADYIDLDSFLLLKDEPFGLLKEADGVLSFKENTF